MEAYGRAGSSVDYTTVWRWTQTFAPEVQRRLRGQAERIDLAHGRDSCTDRSAVGRTCSVPSLAAGKTVDFYLSETRDREAANCFLRRALANPDNHAPHVFAKDRQRSHPAAPPRTTGQLRRSCRHRTQRYSNNRIIESDHRHIKRRLRAMQGRRTTATACAVIAGIEAVQMIRKGHVLGITRKNFTRKPGYSALCSVSINAL